MKVSQHVVFAGAIAALFTAGTLAPAAIIDDPPQDKPAKYTAGHADLLVDYHDGDARWMYRLGSTAVVEDEQVGSSNGSEFVGKVKPDRLITIVPESQRAEAPFDMDFLAIDEGEEIWTLPASEKAGVPFLGFATASAIDTVTVTLNDIEGPGEFGAWSASSFGNLSPVLSSVGPQYNEGITMGSDAHGHWDFGFTAPGEYSVDLKAEGTANGQAFSITDTFKFEVVPEPATAFALLAGGTLLLTRRLRQA